MIEFIHCPQTRSGRVLALLHAMDAVDKVTIREVNVRRGDGSGAPDQTNPHPEHKVPALRTPEGFLMRETNAILLWLTDHFASPLGRAVGTPGRGAYVTWLAYYGNVIEPVLVATMAGLADHPAIRSTFRGKAELDAALIAALADKDWLVDDAYSAADLLVASTYSFAPQFAPDDARVKDWIARCLAQPWVKTAEAEDTARRAAA